MASHLDLKWKKITYSKTNKRKELAFDLVAKGDTLCVSGHGFETHNYKIWELDSHLSNKKNPTNVEFDYEKGSNLISTIP
jgi:hypothetical protein